MSLRIIKPGLLLTIQDTGRYGYQKDGIPVSGAMDTVALRIANLLAGNPESAAALEITLMGPRIEFTQDHLIALTGADLSATINGVPAKMWRPLWVYKGSVLDFGAPATGCRSYLVVAGGIDVPGVLGSYATYLGAGIGGFQGRALQAGDEMNVKTGIFSKFIAKPAPTAQEAYGQTSWCITPQLYPAYSDTPTIRVVKGPEYDQFTQESKSYFWDYDFLVSSQSDRMGYRLQGNSLALDEQTDMLSGAVTFGTIQVPPEGLPIVLMADHQTTGGYPRIGQVITADLPVLAQLAPGKKIRFAEVTLEQAHQLYLQQEKQLEKIKQILHLKANKSNG